jgi:hypothetical protein
MTSIPSWNLGELRQRVRLRSGSERLAIVKPSLDSLEQRWRIARYHYQILRRLLAGLSAWTKREGHLFAIAYGSAEERARLDSVALKITANLLGCLQSMHAAADTFAHLVYYALELDHHSGLRLHIDSLSIKTLQRALHESGRHRALLDRMNELIGHGDFKQLEALVNYSKHRAIVEPVIHADGMEGISSTLTLGLPPIEYKKISYPERPVETFLEAEYLRENHLYIGKLGPQLIAELI